MSMSMMTIRCATVTRLSVTALAASLLALLAALTLNVGTSHALFTCEGSTPPQTYLPVDGKHIKAGELISEFTIYDEATSEYSGCMYIAISAAPYTRSSYGWYANPVGKCNPVQKISGSNFYTCTPSGTDWYTKPGVYKWIAYKVSSNCSAAGACINLTDERSFTVDSDSGGGSGGSTEECQKKLSALKKKLRKLKKKKASKSKIKKVKKQIKDLNNCQ